MHEEEKKTASNFKKSSGFETHLSSMNFITIRVQIVLTVRYILVEILLGHERIIQSRGEGSGWQRRVGYAQVHFFGVRNIVKFTQYV